MVDISSTDDLGPGGHPSLWGIGPARIAELSGATLDAVHKAIQRETLDPGCPWSLVAWITEQLGERDAADVIRAVGHDHG
jgi:hypothetical protein